MNGYYSFWNEPARWPADFDGYRFLAAAVLQLGRAMFGEAWSGREPIAIKSELSILPHHGDTNLEQSHHAWAIYRVLKTYRPKVAELVSFASDTNRPMLTAEHMVEVRALLNEENKVALEAKTKLVAVQNYLIALFREGIVKTALRPISGGDISRPLPNYYWNSEHLDERFGVARMHPDRPHGGGMVGEGFQYIFINILEFERAIAAMREMPRAEICEPRLGTLNSASNNTPAAGKVDTTSKANVKVTGEAQAPKMLAETIMALGTASLTQTQRQIWTAIQDLGGEQALPDRRRDRLKVIKEKVRGSAPSDDSIDKFFREFHRKPLR